MKKAFPVSLGEELIEWIIDQVKSGKYRNRSHVVETALNEFKKKVENESLTKFLK